MKEKLTDQELLNLIKLDKEAGFRILVRTYQEQIYWHIRQMVTYHEDADDVVQNTFIKIYRNIEKFAGDSKLYTWMYRIATNESLTFLRKRKRKQTEHIDDAIFQLSGDEYFDGDEVELKLQAAVATLPDKQKAVFSLRYYDEMPYAEMSEIMDTSVGALKASYHHALKKIESILRNEKAG